MPEDDLEYESAAPFIPANKELNHLRDASKLCQGCHLWKFGTQTVFGDGPPEARMMLVGEQPGDVEDRKGEPFVGPAGKILDWALNEAGIDRSTLYLTNAVKHFKWEARGARRLHKKPNRAEVEACQPWLQAEIESVQPDLIVLLGSTAAQSILGSSFRVSQSRGHIFEQPGFPQLFVTVHPSSLLRVPDPTRRQTERERFVDDLKKAAAHLRE